MGEIGRRSYNGVEFCYEVRRISQIYNIDCDRLRLLFLFKNSIDVLLLTIEIII
jgi:hypothetical protein